MTPKAKNLTARVTEEELALLKKLRESKTTPQEADVQPEPKTSMDSSIQSIADALSIAIERTKPPVKVTVATRKARTAFTPPDGEPMVKLKRKFFHHGLQIEDKLTNKEKTLLNQLKPGRFCEGHVIVTLRRDRGIDIDYPVRTATQRLLLVNRFGIRSFSELLERVIDEKAYPAKYRKAEDKDLYDIDE